MRDSSDHHHRTLDIYVTPACFGSDRARRLADLVRAWSIPDLRVQLHDLADPGVVRPEHVFAVPAYLLDGRLISLGTPDLDWLHRLLSSNHGRSP